MTNEELQCFDYTMLSIEKELNEHIEIALERFRNMYNIDVVFHLYDCNEINAYCSNYREGKIIVIYKGLLKVLFKNIFIKNIYNSYLCDILKETNNIVSLNKLKKIIFFNAIYAVFAHEYGHVSHFHLGFLNKKQLSEYINIENINFDCTYEPSMDAFKEHQADQRMGACLLGLVCDRFEFIDLKNKEIKENFEDKIIVLSIAILFFTINNHKQDNKYPPILWRIINPLSLLYNMRQRNMDVKDYYNNLEAGRIVVSLDLCQLLKEKGSYILSVLDSLENLHDEIACELINEFRQKNIKNLEIWLGFYRKRFKKYQDEHQKYINQYLQKSNFKE